MAYLPLVSFVFENASPKIPARLGVRQSAGYLLTERLALRTNRA